MATVFVGSKLPTGLIIELPDNPKKIEINGLNNATIVGSKFGVTEVDEAFWSEWLKLFSDFKPLKSNTIFYAKSLNSLHDMEKERKKEKTGLERLKQNGDGVTAVK